MSRETDGRINNRENCERRSLQMIEYNVDNILNGSMLCVDPGSHKSGWAYFEAGELVDANAIKTRGKFLYQRLRDLRELVSHLPEADLLAMEFIGDPNWRTLKYPYESLLKSQGIYVGCSRSKYFIEVSPTIWQAEIQDYTKGSDVDDAIHMGRALQAIAMRIQGKEIASVGTEEKSLAADA